MRLSERIYRLAFVGFGEAATAFVTGWGEDRPSLITAYDVKTGPQMWARFSAHSVAGQPSVADALADAQAVFSLVTADQALVAAQSAAGHIADGTYWFDCNSCAPGTKRAAAQVIGAAGGAYVDVAVMAPVHPGLHRVPLLISGPHAEPAEAVLRALGMRPTLAGDAIGQASAIKMIRSVMVKGLEALSAECFLAARRAGVEEAVLTSLAASDPAMQWPSRGAYNLERMMVHGLRRAAEMREVAATVRELGLSDGMSAAAAEWQDRIGALGADAGEESLLARLDRLLAQL